MEENREGKMVYTIVEKARATIGHDKFCEYSVDVCGNHEMRTMHSIASIVSNPNGRSTVQENAHTLSWGGKVEHEFDQVFVD